jgi:hypothetical protein
VAAAAGVAPLLAVALLYWVTGEWRAFYEACFAYQTVYTQRLGGAGSAWTRWLTNFGRLGGTTAALAVGYVPFLILPRARRARWMLYIGYIGSV